MTGYNYKDSIDADDDDNATIELFYGADSATVCTGGTSFASNISEDSEVDEHNWNVDASAGSYYLCAVISDGKANKSFVTANPLTVITPPAIASHKTNLYAKNGVAFNYGFSASGTGLTWSVTGAGGATISSTGNSSATFTVTPTVTGQISYTITVTDTHGYTADSTFILHVNDFNLCIWAGSASSDWSDSSNWQFCAGRSPLSADWVSIGSGTTHQPTITTSTSIQGFADAIPNGGIVTIDSGATLTTMNETATFSSNVTLKGSTDNCLNCKVVPFLNSMSIVNG